MLCALHAQRMYVHILDPEILPSNKALATKNNRELTRHKNSLGKFSQLSGVSGDSVITPLTTKSHLPVRAVATADLIGPSHNSKVSAHDPRSAQLLESSGKQGLGRSTPQCGGVRAPSGAGSTPLPSRAEAGRSRFRASLTMRAAASLRPPSW